MAALSTIINFFIACLLLPRVSFTPLNATGRTDAKTCTALEERNRTIKRRPRQRRDRDLRPDHVEAMRPTSVEILKPMPTMGVPKNSATMAPISARVELILSALKMKGMAAGSLSCTSVSQ